MLYNIIKVLILFYFRGLLQFGNNDMQVSTMYVAIIWWGGGDKHGMSKFYSDPGTTHFLCTEFAVVVEFQVNLSQDISGELPEYRQWKTRSRACV